MIERTPIFGTPPFLECRFSAMPLWYTIRDHLPSRRHWDKLAIQTVRRVVLMSFNHSIFRTDSVMV